MVCVTAKSGRAKLQACLLVYQRGRHFFPISSLAANKVIKSQIVPVAALLGPMMYSLGESDLYFRDCIVFDLYLSYCILNDLRK